MRQDLGMRQDRLLSVELLIPVIAASADLELLLVLVVGQALGRGPPFAFELEVAGAGRGDVNPLLVGGVGRAASGHDDDVTTVGVYLHALGRVGGGLLDRARL